MDPLNRIPQIRLVHVGVDREGGPDVGMAEQSLRYPRGDPRPGQRRGQGVPHGVRGDDPSGRVSAFDPCGAEEAVERPAQIVRGVGPRHAGRRSQDVVLWAEDPAEHPAAVLAEIVELGGERVRDRNAPSAAGLRGSRRDRDARRAALDLGPAQRDELSAPCARGKEECPDGGLREAIRGACVEPASSGEDACGLVVAERPLAAPLVGLAHRKRAQTHHLRRRLAEREAGAPTEHGLQEARLEVHRRPRGAGGNPSSSLRDHVADLHVAGRDVSEYAGPGGRQAARALEVVGGARSRLEVSKIGREERGKRIPARVASHASLPPEGTLPAGSVSEFCLVPRGRFSRSRARRWQAARSTAVPAGDGSRLGRHGAAHPPEVNIFHLKIA